MLKVTPSWDWFFGGMTPEEQKALDEGRLAAVMQEDDENEAFAFVAETINAPAEHTRLAICDPCVADYVLVVAWDARSVECEPEEDRSDDWRF